MLIQGTAYWCKIVGDPQPGYNNDAEVLEWSVDVCNLDEATIQKLAKAGMRMSYIKDKNDERGKFLQLVRKAVKTDGEPSKPIDIIDDHGNTWPAGKLIGNGSIINVALGLNTVKWKGDKWLKPSIISVQVWDHKSYVPKGFPKKADKEETANAAVAAKDQW